MNTLLLHKNRLSDKGRQWCCQAFSSKEKYRETLSLFPERNRWHHQIAVSSLYQYNGVMIAVQKQLYVVIQEARRPLPTGKFIEGSRFVSRMKLFFCRTSKRPARITSVKRGCNQYE